MEKIAIVGIGCRLPKAQNPRQFWQMLEQGIDGIGPIPADRWDVDRYFDPTPMTPGRMYTRWGGFLDQIDQFDATFFGITPKEAERMDPQQRLVLEVAWESLEEAGIDPESLSGSRSGVFLGMGNYDYGRLLIRNPEAINAYDGLGNTLCIAANRISYLLNLQGPSLVLETACSSSLVSLHYACRSLLSGETDLSLVGGVSLMVSPEPTITYSHARMMSATGRCRSFDAAADGYVRSEGCGVVVLRRLSDALAAGDNIRAVILSSAVNQDGRSNGITAPNGLSQQSLIREALAAADLSASDISYVEAHGTGTVLGDPLEFEALQKVFDQDREPGNSCAIGAVKSNIGHLESAAGIAGVIKLALMLQHRRIPGTLHLQSINPYIDLSASSLRIPTHTEDWQTPDGQLRAGISSFGFGGTNAHLVLEAAPEPAISSPLATADHASELFLLSGKTAEALEANRQAFLADWPHWSELGLRDICATLARGRAHFPHRLALVVESCQALRERLAEVPGAATAANSGRGPRREPSIAFLFSGQGSQVAGMGRELYQSESVFREVIDQCETLLAPLLDVPLRQLLFESDGSDSQRRLDQTGYTHPALFCLEFALARQWLHWGLRPSLLVGHSLGEYVAATLAEVFSLEDALRLVCERGRLIQQIPPGGAMEAIWAAPEKIAARIAPWAAELSLAAINGATACVISGSPRAIEAVVRDLQAEGISSRPLPVSHAFHSPQMEGIAAAFAAVAAGVTYRQPTLPILSNLSGEPADASIATAAYWCRHLREPVQFRSALDQLRASGVKVLLEIGPKATLLGLAANHYGDSVGDLELLASLHPKRPDREQMLTSLARLHERGARVRWQALHPDGSFRRLPLPTTQFQRQRHWIEALPPAVAPPVEQPAPGQAAAGADSLAAPMAELIQRGDPLALQSFLRSLVPGSLIADTAVEALALALLSPGASAGAPSLLSSDALVCDWVTSTATTSPPRGRGRRHWILFSEPGAASSSLARLLEAEGNRVLMLPLPLLHTDPQALADRLGAHRLGQAGEEPLECLVLAASCSASPGDPHACIPPDVAAEALLQGVLRVLALTESGPGPAGRLWLVTRQGVALAGEEQDPAQAALWGLAKVLGLEQPARLAAVLDLPEGWEDEQLEALAAVLQREPPESLLALRSGSLRVPRLRRLESAAGNLPELSASHTYLVSGGLGSLGLDLADWLAGRGAGALVLLGRHDPDQRQQERLEGLRQRGCEVSTVRLDVADRDALAELIARIQASTAPLRGVFHCAGSTSVHELADLSWQQWQDVLRPKVQGTWNLHTCTADLALDWFVTFSSIASVWGSRGQAHYAAANAFLDGVVALRRHRHLPAQTIHWGPWQGEGMASDGLRQLLERMGLQPIGRQEGFAALGSLMGSGLSGVTVARLDGRRFREIYELKSASGLLRDLNGPGSDPAEPGLGKADQDSQASATGIAAELAQLPMEEREEALLGRLRTPVASLLGYADPSALDGEANLFDLGMDSLMAMDLVAQIRERFAPEFSFLGMVNDASLRGIARLILQAQDPQAQPSAAAEEAVNLIEQAHLADDIQPPARSASPQSSKPRAILLTGATGFLGAYLLRDLLQQTDAQVFCLVRAKGALAARQRILTNLQRYGLWQEEFAERITPLPGDLSREKLGLEPAVYAELSERIDTVFQSAATLNFVYPYSRLRANNVQGTEEILRFACQGANKTLHYVSTDAVFDASHYYDRTVCEEEPIDHWQGIDLGYTQTKWVAERLVAMARERGLRANIYRPPLITGETGSGFWNTDDFTCLFLKGCIQLGCIPRIDARVTFVPVDYVSRAITALALDPDAQARNHHLTNPHGSTWQQVAAWIEASGHPLASIPYQQWEQRLLQGAERGDNVLAPLLPFFLKRWSDRAYTFAGLAEHRVRLDPTITLARLRGQGIDCPMVDEQLIRSYIRYFERCGFLSQTRAAA